MAIVEVVPKRSYEGELMRIGSTSETIISSFYKSRGFNVTDLRNIDEYRKMEVDFALEDSNGIYKTLETKADQNIVETGNLCFEMYRIQHYGPAAGYKTAWGWKSSAHLLVVRHPATGRIFEYDFPKLRSAVIEYVAECGQLRRELKINIVFTDEGKTTFNLLIPISNTMSGMLDNYTYLTDDEYNNLKR